MTPQRKKIILALFTAGCIIGAIVAIFLGYQLFQNRIKIFFIFSAYIVALVGIVIFFGFRLIRSDMTGGD